MRLVVTAEVRFSRTPDHAVWTVDGPGHWFWTRYLAAFDRVRVVARVRPVADPEPGAVRVDGEGVEVWPLPHYLGVWQYAAARGAVAHAVRAAAAPTDAVLLRVPSAIGTLLATARERQRLPYGLEVVGDPYDVFAPGALTHPLRPVLRYWLTRRLRRQCRTAAAVSYVTQRCLQSRYPCRQSVPTSGYSSIDLPETGFVARPRPLAPPPETIRVVSVGSLAQRYKGVDVLIDALARLASAGRPARLTHLGDGRFRPDLERLARRLGVADRVRFLGAVPGGDPVRRQLDAADLFVMPSRTEGLPRALVEAMARGLPAIGSSVGGIPELLDDEHLVPPGDAVALAGAIDALSAAPNRMAAASARNLDRARDYAAERLEPRRAGFYRRLREVSQGPAETSRGTPETSQGTPETSQATAETSRRTAETTRVGM